MCKRSSSNITTRPISSLFNSTDPDKSFKSRIIKEIDLKADKVSMGIDQSFAIISSIRLDVRATDNHSVSLPSDHMRRPETDPSD